MKIDKKTAGKALVTTGGVVTGALASNAGASALTSIVKNGMIAKGVVALTGVAVAIGFSKNNFVAGAGIGAAGQQVKELVKEVATPHLPDVQLIKDAFEVPALPTAGDGAGRAMARSLAGRMARGRSMGNPTFRMGNGPVRTTGSKFVAG